MLSTYRAAGISIVLLHSCIYHFEDIKRTCNSYCSVNFIVILLGGMWGQEWNSLIKRIKPFPKVPDTDFTSTMKQKNFRPITIFKMADEFYRSIGLYPMTNTFWNKSVIERPSDGRSMNCHGSAHDMNVDDDFRYEPLSNDNK